VKQLQFPTQFATLTKVGTGYTKQEVQQLNEKLCGHWRKFDKKHMPTCWLPWQSYANTTTTTAATTATATAGIGVVGVKSPDYPDVWKVNE